jgi:hypothetical protein
MQSVWESLAYLQNFFQLNFLFSGLEVSSNTVLVARLSIFLISLVGVVYVGLRIIIRVLDCIHAFLSGLGSLPKSFFLLLILVIPLSSDSLGAKWMGYMLIVLSLLGISALGSLGLVLWKHGVDQTLRLINSLRLRKDDAVRTVSDVPEFSRESVVRSMMVPPMTAADGSSVQR